jgi:hypothetical protein
MLRRGFSVNFGGIAMIGPEKFWKTRADAAILPP